jgi:hypothetical protein
VSSQSAGEQPVTRDQLRASKKAKVGRPRAYVFQYKAPTKAFSLKLNFRKSDVDHTEVIAALEGIIDDLRKQIQKP